jgi:hypothetical protein
MSNACGRLSRLAFLGAEHDGPIPPAALAAARAGRCDALATEEMRANVALLARLARDAVEAGKAHRRQGDFIAAGRAFERAAGYARALSTYRGPWRAYCARRRSARPGGAAP